jgi:thioredoxin reductase (NADPH)
LKKLGITLSEDKFIPQYNPETMETNLPGLYLAGVVCGGLDTHLWFIENSRDACGYDHCGYFEEEF